MKSNLLEGVAASLCKEYADQPCSAVEDAVAAAVTRAIAAESYPSENVACDVDFGAACPEGTLYAPFCLQLACVRFSGWADAGDGSTCLVSSPLCISFRFFFVRFARDQAPRYYNGNCGKEVTYGRLSFWS